VNAGILKPADLAGYRSSQVFIAGSKHIPMSEGGRDVMPVFFDLLESENDPRVRAVLGHFIFVYIHPYMDGNGRLARFLMNVMLASGGYPWTVIPVEERERYMASLESASVGRDIKPFAEFLGWLVERSMQGNPVAVLK
jgi:Fic family protein